MTTYTESRRTALAVITVAAMVAALFAVFGSSPSLASDHQITICHWAAGDGNFTSPNPTKSQIQSPTGHDTHSEDIIPPYDAGSHGGQNWDAYPGKNWDADGQAIWNNGCVDPSATTSTTTEPSTTSTTEPSTTTTTIEGSSTLPYTGVESDSMAVLALSLMAAGVLAVIFGRRPAGETGS